MALIWGLPALPFRQMEEAANTPLPDADFYKALIRPAPSAAARLCFHSLPVWFSSNKLGSVSVRLG